MILDSSALIAIVLREPEAPLIVWAITSADRSRVGSPTLLEAEMVARGRRGRRGSRRLTAILEHFEIEEIPFRPEHRAAAAAAFADHGKGRSSARLNFGDCMAFALAKVEGQPLLSLDEAFAATDVELVPLGR